MGGAFELVQFVSRSDHRLTTLRTLAEGSYGRRELQHETNVPRATLARILADMDRENLVIHREGKYSITPLGEVLVSGIQSVLEGCDSTGMPLEIVKFLTRAENRITVLTALTAGPYDRRGLQEATGIPRATLNRILADFRDHGIVMRVGGEYVGTPLGNHLASDLRSLFGMLETIETLLSIERWLPTESPGFDLATLADGTVTLPTPSDPLAPVNRASEAVLEADSIWMISRSATPDTLEASKRAIFDGRGACKVVITTDIVDVIAVDPTIKARLRAADAPGHGGLFFHDGDVRHNLAIVDGTVFIRVHDGEEAIKALVTTLVVLVVGVAITGLGGGAVTPALMAFLGDISPAEDVGKLGGVYNVFGDVGTILGPIVALPLGSAIGYTGGYLVCVGLVALTIVLFGGRLLSASPPPGSGSRSGSVDMATSDR